MTSLLPLLSDADIPQLVRWLDSSLQNGQVDKNAIPGADCHPALSASSLARRTNTWCSRGTTWVTIPRFAILKEGE